MTSTKIHAGESPVGDLFSDAYRFDIPRYQRPYAWTTEQAGEMFDDLLAASSAQGSSQSADPYFLGSIVLVKEEQDPLSDVVDGQQRLTTLTILLSILRRHVSAAFVGSIEKRLSQQGDPLKGTIDEPRLHLRQRDQGFFEKYVQDESGCDSLLAIATDQLTDSQQNVVLNARLFDDRLSELSPEQCEKLAKFIDQDTYLVIVATRDFDSAYRIFTVLNERGLDLTHTDILKSEIIGEIPDSEQDQYTSKWEAEEEDLGRTDFADLFGHIRMIYARAKQRESILREFRASVLKAVPDGRAFIDDILVPLSDAYEVVTRADYKATAGAGAVNELLGWFELIDNKDWIPPAIRYFSKADKDTTELHRFLADLERLAASMHIRRTDVTRRIERYGRVLEAIDSAADLYADTSPLQLDKQEQVDTLARLQGEIYTTTRIRLYVLLRLDSALSGGGATYDHPVITVEHVLPQSPPADSLWSEWFTNEEQQHWVHRLANLVLLTRRKNSEASNYEFDVKKDKYFRTTGGGVSPFALTTQVLNTTEWTPTLLSKRQEELITALAKLWRLG